jgi:hypothetical protein
MDSHSIDMRRWAGLTIFEQMGNIGSEVGRALAAKRRGEAATMQSALFRGLDLIDATALTWASKNISATKEVLRAREQFVEAVTTAKDDPGLEAYFMQYAMAARLHR